MSKEFRIEHEHVLNVAPEVAWAAVNTPEGLASWLFPMGGEDETSPTKVGDVVGGHVVKEWDPPRHSLVRMDMDGFYNAIENTFEQQPDGTLKHRWVHSGIFQGDWDAQYDGASAHTDFYQHSLAEYLAHFAGQHASYIAAEGPESSNEPGSFDRLRAALGISPDALVGQQVAFDIPGVGTIDGVIDYHTPYFLGIRTGDGLYRFYGREAYQSMPTFAGHHLFGLGPVDSTAAQAAWSEWMTELYAGQTA